MDATQRSKVVGEIAREWVLFGLSDAGTHDEGAQRHRVNRLYYAVFTVGRLAMGLSLSDGRGIHGSLPQHVDATHRGARFAPRAKSCLRAAGSVSLERAKTPRAEDVL